MVARRGGSRAAGLPAALCATSSARARRAFPRARRAVREEPCAKSRVVQPQGGAT
ncbi:hypothetical protein SLNHY_2825 [Streptomyces albus]|nr:hypothetical protein SLNHY_2825 [Streptomyces albus]